MGGVNIKPITVTFKEKEQYLYDYLLDKSTSPPTYLKDLLLADYKKPRTCTVQQPEKQQAPNFEFLD